MDCDDTALIQRELRMFQAADYTETVSARLSEVLADIGVDERIVLKRRRAWLQIESMQTISVQLQDENGTIYTLGSKSEGSSTPGLCSDTDQLVRLNDYNVIQDWGDWQPCVRNLLMIQDDTVSPGYCLLQRLRDDVPLSYNDLPNNLFFRDRTERILLRNTITSAAATAAVGGVRHGPAHALQGNLGVLIMT